MTSSHFTADHLAHARALLQRFPLVDGHNDLAYVVWKNKAAKGDIAAFDLERVHEGYDTDIPRLLQGLVGAQVFAAFLPTSTPNPLAARFDVIDVVLQLEQRYPHVFQPVRRAADIVTAHAAGKIGSIIGVESLVGIEGSMAQLRALHALGVRIVTLCHNESLPIIDSATDHPIHQGLSELGRHTIAEMNRLGLIVDLAHASSQAQRDAIAASQAPVVISHANAAALCDHPRNVVDDVLDQIKTKAGVVMATFVPAFLSQPSYDWLKPLYDGMGKVKAGADRGDLIGAHERSHGSWPKSTRAQVADHIEYMAGRMGVDHVGIGSDYYGGPVPVGLEDVSKMPELIADLVARGWSDDALAKLCGGNFLRVFTAVEATAAVAPPDAVAPPHLG